MLLRIIFQIYCHILGGILSSANTGRTCIRIRANAGTFLANYLCIGVVPRGISEKTNGRGKLRGGKTYHKAPSQKRFLTPPPVMIRFPPAPPLLAPCHFPYRKRAQSPRRIPFSEASKTVFGGGTLWYVPPPKSHDTFCPRK